MLSGSYSNKMKTIITLLAGIFFLTIVMPFSSAIYPGECANVNFPNINPVNFQVEQNTTPLTDFSWNKSGSVITYCFTSGAVIGNYTFKWFNEQTVVTNTARGGSRTVTKEVNRTIPGPTVYQDKNITIIKNISDVNTDEYKGIITEKEKEITKRNQIILAGSILALLIIIYLVYFFSKRKVE